MKDKKYDSFLATMTPESECGVGAWTVEWCEACSRVLADSSRGCPEHYRWARRIRHARARPELRIVRECKA